MVEQLLERAQLIRTNPITRRKGWGRHAWNYLSLPFLLFIVLPLVSLFFHTTIGQILTNLNEAQVTQAIGLSLVTSLMTTGITILFGTPVAYLLSKRRARFYRLVDTLVDLPTILPPAVAGVALLLAFGRRGLLGSWLAMAGITIPFTQAAVVMAQTFIAAPLFIRAASIGFSAVDRELIQAAELDGANRWQILRYVTLPLTWMALLGGSVLTWARALGEFGATIIFAGNFPGRTQTMPLAIYIGFEIDLNVAVTLSIILISLSFLTLIIMKSFLHKRMDFELRND